jgi:hypothetical protein
MTIEVEISIVIPHNDAVGYHLHSEDGGSKVLRNVGILPRN